ncbi:hypothetical protein PVAP13_3KG203821 [Panicum virgatum]|uniref:Uncharacterized protein n=1 Tax=Panicum virgatum TaxID=38727 RepID=A0A8T0UWD4_PANVG|nr:hypothetical protein PVAP13_3KG203821 [Panicum virgatum]
MLIWPTMSNGHENLHYIIFMHFKKISRSINATRQSKTISPVLFLFLVLTKLRAENTLSTEAVALRCAEDEPLRTKGMDCRILAEGIQGTGEGAVQAAGLGIRPASGMRR